jgi:uncharacterized protein HemX
MHNNEFDDIVNTETWGPYGPETAQPVKTGLTKRGKAGLAIGAAVLAGGGILTWSHQNTEAKASEIQAQELQYKRDLLALEMQKEINKANAASEKAQETRTEAEQKLIDACVNADKGLIGKQLGVTYRSVMKDCQDQYGTSSDTSVDMQQASSTSDAGGGGEISPTVLFAIAAGGALVIGAAAIRGKKTHAA